MQICHDTACLSCGAGLTITGTVVPGMEVTVACPCGFPNIFRFKEEFAA